MKKCGYVRIVLGRSPNQTIIGPPTYERWEEYRQIKLREAKDISRLHAACQRQRGYTLALSKKGRGTICVAAPTSDEVITAAGDLLKAFYGKKGLPRLTRTAVMNFIPSRPQADKLDKLFVDILFAYRDEQKLPSPDGSALPEQDLRNYWFDPFSSRRYRKHALILQK